MERDNAVTFDKVPSLSDKRGPCPRYAMTFSS